jgi:integrase
MYMVPKFGPKPVNSISRADLAAWVADLTRGKAPARYKVRGSNPPRDHPARTMRAPLAPASIEHMVTILGAIFKWAMANDRIAKNPATGLSIPRPVPEDHVYLTHNQVRDLAAAAQNATGDRQDAALVYTLAYTGLSSNEALAAKTGALDTAARTLRVAQTWTQGRDGGRKLGPPTSWARRTGPLPGFLADPLADRVQGRGPGEFVFTARRGGPVFDHNWRRRVWDKAVAAAELDGLGLTPHKLRHTAASAAIAAGADVKVVQQMLGHASAAMTLDVYGHLWPSRLGEVAAAMEAARQAEYQTPNPAPKPARPTGPEL